MGRSEVTSTDALEAVSGVASVLHAGAIRLRKGRRSCGDHRFDHRQRSPQFQDPTVQAVRLHGGLQRCPRASQEGAGYTGSVAGYEVGGHRSFWAAKGRVIIGK